MGGNGCVGILLNVGRCSDEISLTELCSLGYQERIGKKDEVEKKEEEEIGKTSLKNSFQIILHEWRCQKKLCQVGLSDGIKTM